MQGALPSQDILRLIREGCVLHADENRVQPSSLDLTVGEEIFRLPFLFLPKSSETVQEVAREIGAEPFSFEYPLEVGVPYLIRLREVLKLPQKVYAYANPKSSVGRNDLRVSMLADRITRFDAAGERGYEGSLWAIVEPKSYRVKLHPGDALLQMRFFYSDTRFSHQELGEVYRSQQLLYLDNNPFAYDRIKVSDRDGGLIMTVDLESEDPNLAKGQIGWRAENTQRFLDFSKVSHYSPDDFFVPVFKSSEGTVRLRRGDFYIFYTRECLRVPPGFAAEIAAVDVRSGEYRSHYAGFIDPGWGHGRDGSQKGSSIVLEVRPFEDNIVLRNRQPVCKVIFERMADIPDRVYGEESGSHYAKQSGPRLSKHFRYEKKQ